MNLEKLVEMSQRYGKDDAYVLAGGGNTSVKDDDVLYIKGSGTQLATITADGFVQMERPKLDESLQKEYPAEDDAREAAALADLMDARAAGSGDKRPSVETLLHHLFPYTYVLHLHPAMVNGLTCGQQGEEIARRLFGDDMFWVPIYRPGYALSKYCQKLMKEHKQKTGKDAQIALLQNHGVFVAADTVEEIDQQMRRVMNSIEDELKERPSTAMADVDSDLGLQAQEKIREVFGTDHVLYSGGADLMAMLESEDDFYPLSAPFSPDHIVYCKAHFLYIQEIDQLADAKEAFEKEHGYTPVVICLRGVGAFMATGSEAEVENAKLLFDDAVKVAVYSRSFGGPLHMTDELVHFIIHWEVESYRQKVAAK